MFMGGRSLSVQNIFLVIWYVFCMIRCVAFESSRVHWMRCVWIGLEQLKWLLFDWVCLFEFHQSLEVTMVEVVSRSKPHRYLMVNLTDIHWRSKTRNSRPFLSQLFLQITCHGWIVIPRIAVSLSQDSQFGRLFLRTRVLELECSH